MKHSVLALTLFALPASLFAQGPLSPTAPPAPTMKSLAQIEPRTPISALPATISVSGSYYVTTNLTGTLGQNAITILASDVTLDLSGFTLQGVAGSGNGITVPNPEENLAIRNGVLDSWGNRGVYAIGAYNSQFERLRVSNSTASGLYTGSNCVVSVCTASGNSNGILVGNGCTIKDCAASGNSVTGIAANNNCTVIACSVSTNSGDGISVGKGCVVADCTSYSNSSDGINCGDGTGVRGCSSYQNGGNGVTTSSNCTIIACTASGNYGYYGGIFVGNGCTVKDCTADGNGSGNSQYNFGIYAGSYCSVIACTTSGNGPGGGGGIAVSNGCAVVGCIVSGNNSGTFTYGIAIRGNQNRIDSNTVGNNGGFGIFPFGANVTNSITRNSAFGNVLGNYYAYGGNTDYAPTGTPATATSPWTNFQ